MMADATTGAVGDAGQSQEGRMPLPLVLLVMDMLQARGRAEAVARLVEEIYARSDQASR